MSQFNYREYYLLVRRQGTAQLEQILNTPIMHARLTRKHMEIIRLVLRQRQRRFEGIIAEREATT